MNLNYRIGIIVGICLLLFGGVIHRGHAGKLVDYYSPYQDQNAGEWQRYAVSGEEFSVLLPVVPAMNTETTHIDMTRSRRERILGAYSNGVVYAIYTFEKKSLSLDDLTRRFTNKNQPTVQTEPVTVNGVTGKGSRFETSDRMGAVLLFETPKNVYVFHALGSKLGDPGTGIPKFFSSVRFEKNPRGIKVLDGPGDLPSSNTQTTQGQTSIFTGRQVELKGVVVTKPEPRYTEGARMNQVTGTVVLRAVFSSSGVVTNIHTVSSLRDGLTERAIEAARQIRFVPAIKDGRFVSMWIELQYNFNLY